MNVPGKPASGGSIYRQRPNRRPRITPPGPQNLQSRTPNTQISNRECNRTRSNPSRGGSFLSDPPAVRPRFSRGIPQQEIQIQQPSRLKNSNPEALRLETAVTQTKQTTPTRSNRELERCFSPSKFDPRRGAGSLRPRVGTGFWPGSSAQTGSRTGITDENPNPRRATAWADPSLQRRRQLAPNKTPAAFEPKRRAKRICVPPDFVAIKKNLSFVLCELAVILIAPCCD